MTSHFAPLVHNWTFKIGGLVFGFQQWGNSSCEIYCVTYIGTVPFSAPVTAAGLLLIVALLIFGGLYLFSHRTRKSDPDDA